MVLTHFDQQVSRRESPTTKKLSLKDETKVQNSSKKGNASIAVNDPDKVRKHRDPVVNKTTDVAYSINLGNLVKVVHNSSRRWTDGSVSWASLPSPLAELGKVPISCSSSSGIFFSSLLIFLSDFKEV